MAINRLRNAPSRKFFTWAAVGMLSMIAVLLAYRAITGTTIREDRERARAEKAAEELRRLAPPNAESLSAKLEAARLEAEKNRPAPPVELPVPVANPAPPALLTPKLDIAPEDLDAYEERTRAGVAPQLSKSSLWQSADARAFVGGNPGSSVQPQPGVGNVDEGPIQTQQRLMQAHLERQAALQQPATNSAQQFRDGLSKQAGRHEAPLQVRPASKGWMILEGTSIPVVIEDDVSSDIPGKCRARVAQDVLDSLTQSMVLIPAHARLICTYDTGVVQGQDKMLLAFTRLIYPNGASIALGGMDASDRYGAAGAPAEVNSRFWQIFGSSFMIAAVTRWAEPTPPAGGGVTVVTTGGQVGGLAAGVLADTAKRVLDRNINVRPELRLKAGDVLRITVSNDLAIDPQLIQPSTRR